MTTSRIVRGTKGRIFVYVIAVIFVTGVIACYNSTLTQLDDFKKNGEVCQQEKEKLGTQLDMVSEYKQRLEKSLKSEKTEHLQVMNDLENKHKEEKNKDEKAAEELKTLLTTLQKHYNLLQTEYDDFKKESAINMQEQSNEINQLQAGLKELKEHAKKLEVDREHLKTDYMELKNAKESLEAQIRDTKSGSSKWESENNRLELENKGLKEQLESVKGQLAIKEYDSLQAPNNRESENASKKQEVLEAVKAPQSGVGEEPPAEEHKEPINNNENVIVEPKNVVPSQPSSKASLNGAVPLSSPNATQESLNKVSKFANVINEAFLPMPYKKLPDGVVRPIPQQMDLKKTEDDKNSIDNEINEALPNRYRSNIIEMERKHEEVLEKSEMDLKLGNKKIEEVEKENGAHEVFDDKNAKEVMAVGDNPNEGKGFLGPDGMDYDKEGANDVQLEQDDPEEDDDPDDMGGHMARRPKDPAVRN